MEHRKLMRGAIFVALAATLASCGGIGSGDSSPFRRNTAPTAAQVDAARTADEQRARLAAASPGIERNGKTRIDRGTIWDIFGNAKDPNNTVEVNKYLWQASLEVLNFLPVQSVDPFSGVIVTGYGTPPGGGRAYRATIYVQDPALDARSLKIALATRNGPVDTATQRAVEDAILTRARQLRIRDTNL